MPERFLSGGGEASALMRELDWSGSPLGRPDTWPQSLRSVVGLMLGSKFPMFVAWGPELGFLYNDAYTSILGAKHPAAMGRRFEDIWSEIWADVGPLAHRALAGEATWLENLPLVMHRKGYDEQTWFTFSYSPVRDESGAIAGMFCACNETTDQILAERRLETERQGFARLFDQAPTFMAVLDGPEHRFRFINPAYQRLIGERDVIGKRVVDALPETVEQGFITLLDQVYTSGEAFTAAGAKIELEVEPGQPSETRYLDFVYQPMHGDDGAVTGIFVEGADMTERTVAEHQLRELNASLGERVEAEVAARTKAEDALRQSQKMEAVGQLTGGIAHDFNNLLTGITGSLELLKHRLAAGRLDTVDRYIHAAEGAAKRAAALTHRLLAFSRRQTLDPKPTNVNRLVADMEELIRRTVGPHI